VDLRQYELFNGREIPTKKGISLKLVQFKELSVKIKEIEESLQNNEARGWHLGYNVYAHVREDNPCVDILQYWKPEADSDVVPTKKGLCLRPIEYKLFRDVLEETEKLLPELKDVERCIERDDHQNQLGMLRCNICNPNDYMNW
jgi:hypothetical protein